MLGVDKKGKFSLIVENASRCDLCERMTGRTKVLSEKNGSIDARVVFVAEAPGRLGADRTGVPLHGDQAGQNFERLLGCAGLTRPEVFITNALLCNPRTEKGNNGSPTKNEVSNCSVYLSILLDIIEPDLIVPLGRCALDALHAIQPHGIQLRRDVCKSVKWGRYAVFPMYHPGPRAVIHRSSVQQERDFAILGEIIGREAIHQKLRMVGSSDRSLAQQIILKICSQLPSVSKFKLTKLLYLLDWRHVQETGAVITGFYYIFQKDGPLATGLTQALKEMEGDELLFRFERGIPTYSSNPSLTVQPRMPAEVAERVDALVERCRLLTDAQMKVKAYLTPPMRNMLARRKLGESMANHPVFDGWIGRR